MIKLAKEIRAADARGEELSLSIDEVRFNDALTGGVYPFIEDALGTTASVLDQHRRVELWKAYRKVCVRPGPSVIPEGSSARPYVDDNLNQAGVPSKYLAQLAVKLESHVHLVRF